MVPRIAVDAAQVIPDNTIVVKRVLVLQDVIQVIGLGKLD